MRERAVQTRLELNSVINIPESVEGKRLIDKYHCYLLESDFTIINRPIRDWLYESRDILIGYFSRKSKQDIIADKTFIDGINHAFTVLLTELAYESDELEQQLIDIILPLIVNFCGECKKEINT